MNESISTAAGAGHGQFRKPAELRRLIRELGRRPAQRDTLYRRLRTFSEAADGDEAGVLDAVTDADGRFGSYRELTRDRRYHFKRPTA
jgi:hypothetical protein